MSVKTKDRHVSKQECLGLSRVLVQQILIITHPREFDQNGKQIRKPGLLGEGQPLQAFGIDLLRCGKAIHAYCYQACEIYLKDKETLDKRTVLHRQAIEQCDSILRQLDLCIFEYASKSKKKRKSFEHIARLTRNVKRSIQDRLNRDNLIYHHNYVGPKRYRRGR